MRQGAVWFKLDIDEAIKQFEIKNWKHRSDFMNEEYHEHVLYKIEIPCWKTCEEKNNRSTVSAKLSSLNTAILFWKHYSKIHPTQTNFEHKCPCGAVYSIHKEY
jgi:hypothetical protein